MLETSVSVRSVSGKQYSQRTIIKFEAAANRLCGFFTKLVAPAPHCFRYASFFCKSSLLQLIEPRLLVGVLQISSLIENIESSQDRSDEKPLSYPSMLHLK